MKKTVILLLTLALLAACLAGCSEKKPSPEETAFREALQQYYFTASSADSDLFALCSTSRQYMEAQGINGDDHMLEIVSYTMDNAQGISIDKVTNTMEQAEAQAAEIQNNQWAKENAQFMIDESKLLANSLRQLYSCFIGPTGSAEEYKQKYNKIDDYIFEHLENINDFLNPQ